MRAWLIRTAMAAAVLTAGTALAQGDVIAERRAGLKRMGEHMQALKAVVDKGDDVQRLSTTVDEMAEWYKTMPNRFPSGSDRGDTRALPAIWTERENFEAVNTKMLNQFQVLRAAAASGDKAAFAAAFKETGQACGACHRPYRQPTR